jgi:rubrerythrin
MATNYQLLEKAERLELLAQQIYEALSQRFGGETRETFQRLAAEESQHASRVRLLGARYRQDRRLVASLAIDDRLLAEAGEALAAVRAGAWDGDASAAMASAAELESRFCQAHAQSLSQGAMPELRSFFEQLASQDKAHATLLKR